MKFLRSIFVLNRKLPAFFTKVLAIMMLAFTVLLLDGNIKAQQQPNTKSI